MMSKRSSISKCREIRNSTVGWEGGIVKSSVYFLRLD